VTVGLHWALNRGLKVGAQLTRPAAIKEAWQSHCGRLGGGADSRAPPVSERRRRKREMDFWAARAGFVGHANASWAAREGEEKEGRRPD
jgi:hypothetical protein